MNTNKICFKKFEKQIPNIKVTLWIWPCMIGHILKCVVNYYNECCPFVPRVTRQTSQPVVFVFIQRIKIK